MTAQPTLHVATPSGDVQAVALVLHGGRAKSSAPVRGSQLAVLRMAPFATSLRRGGARHGLAVARLRYRVRGWNGGLRSPVADVQWALDRIGERYPDAPIALVGHSMGGRAAVYAAGHHSVRAVVGLAPWIEPGDPVDTVTDRHVLVAHGDRDRMTNPRGSAAWTQRAQAVAASAVYVSVAAEKHAMLHRASLWHELATTYVLATLCGVQPEESDNNPGANVIARALAGDTPLVV